MTTSSTSPAVLVPMINPNDPSAQVVEVSVLEGQQVRAGDVVCKLQTAKASVEVATEIEGVVQNLRISVGQLVATGDTVCEIAQSPSGKQPAAPALAPKSPSDLRITEPARDLAKKLDVSLDKLPSGPVITSAWMRKLAQKRPEELAAQATLFAPARAAFRGDSVIVFGGGGHAAKIVDLLRQLCTPRVMGIVDDRLPAGGDVLGAKILGGRDLLPSLKEEGTWLAINAVAGLDRSEVRAETFQLLASHGFGFPSLVHPTAQLEPTATLEAGTQVFAQAFIGSAAHLEFGAIVNTGAIVSHHCVIGAYTHIAPGALLGGDVKVGAGALIGMGVTVHMGVRIGTNVRIGNGARIHEDVPSGLILPSGSAWP